MSCGIPPLNRLARTELSAMSSKCAVCTPVGAVACQSPTRTLSWSNPLLAGLRGVSARSGDKQMTARTAMIGLVGFIVLRLPSNEILASPARPASLFYNLQFPALGFSPSLAAAFHGIVRLIASYLEILFTQRFTTKLDFKCPDSRNELIVVIEPITCPRCDTTIADCEFKRSFKPR
jgi:hypothetical protein